MKITELKQLLLNEGVPENNICIGPPGNRYEALGIEDIHGTWEIYYSERGQRRLICSFESEEAANRELAAINRGLKPNSSNEDYRVESYIANILDKTIYPFGDNKNEENEENM